jgi:RNA polymerase sigma-70 factor (ECF subfamily)
MARAGAGGCDLSSQSHLAYGTKVWLILRAHWGWRDSGQSVPAARPYYLQRVENGVASALPQDAQNDRGEVSDLSLVAGVRARDESAMAGLYDRYSSLVYSVALRVLGDTGAAEDVLQEIFLQLWRKPAAFDAARGSMGAWLSVIARNRSIDALRKRRPETDIEDVVLSVETNLADVADRGRVLAKIREVLGTMAAPQKSALEMAFFEGLTHTEIAAKTGEPLGTIKTRIRAALLCLRQAVGG